MSSVWGPKATVAALPSSTGLAMPAYLMEQALEYATMGERFLAFLIDGSIEAVLVAVFLVYYAESSLDSEALKRIAPGVIPWAYMTLCEFFFHRTLGKCLLRIQLRADSSESGYPSFFRILLRETIGKLVSGLILGIGFLAGFWNDKHKTWADRMASTVVVRTGTVSGRLKAVLAPVLICANLGISYALTHAAARYKISLVEQLEATERKDGNLRLPILLRFTGAQPGSPEQYQKTLAALPPMLDEYSRLLAEEQRLLMKLRKYVNPTDAPLELTIYKEELSLRQEIVKLVRSHVEMVLAFDPSRQTFRDLLQDRERLLDEIRERNDRIKKLESVLISLNPVSLKTEALIKEQNTPFPKIPKQSD